MLNDNTDANSMIDSRIIENMSEGVITFDRSGKIISVNKAASVMLGKSQDELLGSSFTASFIDMPGNDDFNQIFLDAIYDPNGVKEAFAPYENEGIIKHFRIIASCLKQNEETSGVILVLSDMTELLDLRDATRAMNEINRLNARLEERNAILQKTFGRFLSDEIVHNLLDKPGNLALGGKKARLSIMMSDLRGFTALSERMDANKLIDMLNHYLGEMTEIIQRHRGTIIEFIGDGIMALFGAPSYFDEHADEAAAAAVEMQAAMIDINRWNRENGFPELQMGIGLNLGDVILGNIGSEKRTKYGIVGKEVNLCGRIESFTVGGEILISESIYDSLTCPVSVSGQREIVPKGSKKPMRVYSISGLGEPYNVSYNNRKYIMRRLEERLEISFFKVQDKNILSDDHKALITEIGADSCIMQSEVEMSLYDNVVINVYEGVYGKVISTDNADYLVVFTSCPKEFESFVNDLK